MVGDCAPRRRASAAPTEAFALKTAPSPTIKLDESNRLVTVEEAGLRGQTLKSDLSGGCA